MSFSFSHTLPNQSPIEIPAIGLDLRVRLSSHFSGGVLTIIETTNAPGFGPPLHRHKECEIFYILEGSYLVEVDGKRVIAGVGELITVPGGVSHAFVNVTNRPARQLVYIQPGLDAAVFFTNLGEIMLGGRPDAAALNAFGASWGVEFLGPPLTPPAGV